MKNKSFMGGMLAVVLVLVITVISCGEAAAYTVTFDSNGGSSVQAISGATSGTTISLPANPVPNWTDSYFAGWFIDNNTFQNQFTSSTVIASNLTVYAKWNSAFLADNCFEGIWTSHDCDPQLLKFVGNNWFDLSSGPQGTFTATENQITFMPTQGLVSLIPFTGNYRFLNPNTLIISGGIRYDQTWVRSPR